MISIQIVALFSCFFTPWILIFFVFTIGMTYLRLREKIKRKCIYFCRRIELNIVRCVLYSNENYSQGSHRHLVEGIRKQWRDKWVNMQGLSILTMTTDTVLPGMRSLCRVKWQWKMIDRPHGLNPTKGPLDLRAQLENMGYAEGWVGSARGSVWDSLCLRYPLHMEKGLLRIPHRAWMTTMEFESPHS